MIRPAIPADEAAIRACAEAAYARYIAVIGRRPAPMDADYAAQIAAGQVWVAEDDGFQGFIVFHRTGDSVLLENVAVSPGKAGRGIGKKLTAFCEATARQEGARAVQLYTNLRMAENLAIYPRLGYVETGRRSDNGFDRVFFEKLL